MVVILVTTRTSKHSATHDQESMKARVRVIVGDASNRKQVCVSYINTLVLRCFISLSICVLKRIKNDGEMALVEDKSENRTSRTENE